jgi:hypothetical protein
MGRKKIVDKREDLSIDKIIKFYNVLGSARKVGDALHLDKGTVTKYLKMSGVECNQVGWSFTNEHLLQLEGRSKGAFIEWLEENQDRHLPRDIRSISEMTGIPYDVIKSTLYRHHRKLQRWVRAHIGNGELRKARLRLGAISSKGDKYTFNTGLLNSYKINIDKWTCQIFITGYVKAKEGTYSVTFFPLYKSDLQVLLGDITKS